MNIVEWTIQKFGKKPSWHELAQECKFMNMANDRLLEHMEKWQNELIDNHSSSCAKDEEIEVLQENLSEERMRNKILRDENLKLKQALRC